MAVVVWARLLGAGAKGAAMDELDGLDAVDQADLVRRGEVTSLELIEAAIARIEGLRF